MRLKFKTFEGGVEVEMVAPTSERMRMADTAALQRETGWKMQEISDLWHLEVSAMALAVYYSLRAVGRKVTYAKAEELLDDAEFIPEPGDDVGDEPEPDPTKAPAGDGEGSNGTL